MAHLTRRTFLLTGGGLAAGAALAACGSSGAATKKVSISGAGSGLDTSRPYGGNPATEGTPVAGGTLRVGMDREAISFDPVVQGTNEAASAIYDSLLKFDANGDPQPYLAKSMTTPDGGRTWILTLRPNVTFHDGTPLDAEAVVFNVRRHQTTSTSPAHLYTENIASMSTVDTLTVKFVLSAPMGSFASNFALPWAQGSLGIIGSPRAIRAAGANYGRAPVGAGPFRFVRWIPDNHITMTRFDRYWQKGLPRLDGLEFRPLPDTETRYSSIQNGDVDLIFAGYFDEIYRSSRNENLVTYYGLGGGAEYLIPNVTRAPFNDRRMREALVRAIDPNALSATQFDGAMSRATTAFATNSPYYSTAAANGWPAHDPARATQLIHEYTSGGGDANFTLDAPNSPDRVLLATFLQAQWAGVGLKVQVRFSDLAKLSSTLVQSGDFQLSTWVSGPWDSPYPYMYNMFHTKGNANYGRYSSAEADKALQAAVSTTDPAARIAAYRQAQEVVNKDLAVIWDSRANLGTITRKNVRGVVRYLVRDMFWATAWLAK